MLRMQQGSIIPMLFNIYVKSRSKVIYKERHYYALCVLSFGLDEVVEVLNWD